MSEIIKCVINAYHRFCQRGAETNIPEFEKSITIYSADL
jgi:hypothetical protein